MDLSRLKAIKDKQAQESKEQALATKQELAQLKNQELIVQVAKSVVDFIAGHTTKTVVLNQIQDFATSQDAEKLVQSITSLHETLKTHENTDISPLTEVMNQALEQLKLIPKEHPEEKEEKFIDYTQQIKDLTDAVDLVQKAIKAQKLNVEAPVVNVDAPVVNVDAPDLKPITKEIEKAFIKAIGGIPQPEATDIKPLVTEQKKTNKLLLDIRDMPRGGSGGGSTWIAVNSDGTPVPLELTADGKLPVSLTSSADPSSFYVYDIEEDTTSYYGNTNVSGAWMIKKVTGTLVSYATVTNNATVTSYTDAWTDRATLTYGRIDEAF